MKQVQLFHNPRCSKSRTALSLLKENGCDPDVVLYLEETLAVDQLTKIFEMLGMSPFEVLRKGDLQKLELPLPESEQELIDLMVANPKIIERPIAIRGDRAVIGRPPENVLSLLK